MNYCFTHHKSICPHLKTICTSYKTYYLFCLFGIPNQDLFDIPISNLQHIWIGRNLIVAPGFQGNAQSRRVKHCSHGGPEVRVFVGIQGEGDWGRLAEDMLQRLRSLGAKQRVGVAVGSFSLLGPGFGRFSKCGKGMHLCLQDSGRWWDTWVGLL